MASTIQTVARAAHRLFSRMSAGSGGLSEHIGEVAMMMDKLQATDLNFSFHDDPSAQQLIDMGVKAPAVYVHLWEDRVLSMGIFVIRQGCRIPLHNHPNMYGICKVIQGTVDVRSYTPVDATGLPIPDNIKQKLSQFSPVMKHSQTTLSADDRSCVLSPVEGNIHEIASVDGPAAFVDILAPPYDHETGSRVCQYYQDCSDHQEQPEKFDKSGIHWLRNVPPPRNFWCDMLDYTGPPIDLG